MKRQDTMRLYYLNRDGIKRTTDQYKEDMAELLRREKLIVESLHGHQLEIPFTEEKTDENRSK